MQTPMIRILLVDDDLHIRTLGREILEKLGYAVETAGTGEEVLARFRQGQPLDLVILDCHLPGMSGLEVVRQLQAQYPGVGVLAASGYFSSRDKDQLKAGGARGFLCKPFRMGELRSRIAEVLGDHSRP
jgi:two-component system, cell cycle sensor histidine kinase and response regulator CckA